MTLIFIREEDTYVQGGTQEGFKRQAKCLKWLGGGTLRNERC